MPKVFNDLTEIRYIRNDKQGFQWWWYKCICGKEKEIRSLHVRKGHTKSCGCRKIRVSSTHNMSSTSFYSKWRSMIKRCSNKGRRDNNVYLNRGIKPIKRWYRFENFKDDMYESYLKHSKLNGENRTSIDRIDNNKGYTKLNCRWATPKIQSNNRRDNHRVNYKGKSITISELSQLTRINSHLIIARLSRGWSLDDSVEKPKREERYKFHKRYPNGRIKYY